MRPHFTGSFVTLSSVMLLLIGCAGTSNVKGSKTQTISGARLPASYLESTSSLRLSQVTAVDCKSKFIGRAESDQDWRRLIEIGNSCVQQKNWRSTERVARLISQQQIESPWGPYFRSLVSEARGESGKAMWMIESALRRGQNVGLLYYQKGRLHQLRKEMDLAVANFEKASELDSSLYGSHLLLGQIYFGQGETEKSKSYFQMALKVLPEDSRSLIGFAECLAREKNFQGAADILARVTTKNPSELKLRLRRADLLASSKSGRSEAVREYREVLSRRKAITGGDRQIIENKIHVLELELSKEAKVKVNQDSQRSLAAQEKGEK